MTEPDEKLRSEELSLDSQMSDERQLVVFRLSDEEFGVDIENVKEIVRLPDITLIPKSPDYVAGICNLRGNVLPVIDTRARFSLDTRETTDHTRLLVVDTGDVQTGLIVDSVREVMRMRHLQEEPPPAACKGVDRQFLSGVVKVDDGERLVLKLNLNEVLSIDMDADSGKSETRDQESGALAGQAEEVIEEEQLVSFKVADDEYAFDIDKVREIIKIREVTAVPNVPGYVRGLFTIRNHLLPIIDLRELLGLPSLVSERHQALDKGLGEHRVHVEHLRHVLEAGSRFTSGLNPKETPFGAWLEAYNTSSIEIETIIKRLKKRRADIFAATARALELGKSSKDAAMTLFKEHIQPFLEIIIDTLDKFKRTVEQHILEDQRALVVEANSVSIGYLVDCVDEVLRIPRSVIDQTPAMASSDRKELKAVAKLDEGDRLIMIMDESALVSHETSRILSKQIQDTGESNEGDADDKLGKSLAQQIMDEDQLVTFTINKEEYGIRIMQVQEINRLTDITVVPRAPYFVDGMTNLRGNVIPVISIRKLFDLEDRDADDRTRIIIVDIRGNKTGLRVDQVNEVLRLEKRDIVKTPNIVISDGVNRYMEGVCKIDEGKRMVVLLNMEKILNEDELRKLSETTDTPYQKTPGMTEALSVPEDIPEDTTTEEREPVKKKLEIAE